jgi:uncharacterized protein
LSIDKKRDVIELPIDDLLDINGWDIRKALQLFRKSNPPLLEWLRSGIVYVEQYAFADQLRDLSRELFSPVSCMHHYLNMARGNYREFLQREEVKIKKYFYVLRPILACKWIEKYNSIPPLLFQDHVEALIPSGELHDQVINLLNRKIAGEELDIEPRIAEINEFIETEIKYLSEYIKTISKDGESEDPTDILNKLFRETLQDVYAKK